jgi:hypothetical protein
MSPFVGVAALEEEGRPLPGGMACAWNGVYPGARKLGTHVRPPWAKWGPGIVGALGTLGSKSCVANCDDGALTRGSGAGGGGGNHDGSDGGTPKRSHSAGDSRARAESRKCGGRGGSGGVGIVDATAA